MMCHCSSGERGKVDKYRHTLLNLGKEIFTDDVLFIGWLEALDAFKYNMTHMGRHGPSM